jgi:hypothetical protein
MGLASVEATSVAMLLAQTQDRKSIATEVAPTIPWASGMGELTAAFVFGFAGDLCRELQVEYSPHATLAKQAP